MSKRSLLGLALAASLLGGVACDEDPVPGDPTLMGGHWVGEAAAIFGGIGPSIGISTDAGEIRIISFFGDDVDAALAGPSVPPSNFQLVVNASENGAPSELILDFLEGEVGVEGEELAAFDTGLAGTLKLYINEELFDASSPAGIEPIGGPPAMPWAVIGCSSAGAGEGVCNHDGALAQGIGLAGVVEVELTEPTDAATEEPAEVDVIAYHAGQYVAESFEQPSALANLVGEWGSVMAPAGFDVSADGTIEGGDIASCTYGGSFSILDATVNAYRMNLIVTDCGEWDGSYSGLAAVLDPEIFGEIGGDLPDATEGDVLIFHVDNGEFAFSSVMMAYGIGE